MKKQSLSISIPQPCHEKWSEMTPVEQGRHCASCQKKVVDFTKMPKIKIAEFVSRSEGQICGRFTSDQLEVGLIPQKPNKSWLKYAALLLGLAPTIGLGQNTHIQASNTTIHPFSNQDSNDKNQSHPSPSKKQTTNRVMKGKVIDAQFGEAIIFGSVAAFNSNQVSVTIVETDIDGKFAIEVPYDGYLEASSLGYSTTKVHNTDLSFDGELIIKLDESILMDAQLIKGMVAPQTFVIEEEEEKMLHYQLPMVSINSKPQTETHTTVIGGVQVIGSIGLIAVKRKNWFERQFEKLVALVKKSHKEAIENKNKGHRIENEEEVKLLYTTSIRKSEPAIAQDLTPETISDQIHILTKEVAVFPNPTTGKIQLQLPDHMSSVLVEVISMQNQLIYSQMHNSNEKIIDISSLPPASYVISIIHDRNLVFSKLIIKI